MDDFRKEVKEYSKDDLQLILADQRDLYSAEEIEIIQEELNSRGGASTDFSVESVVQATLQDQLETDVKNQEEKERQERLALIEYQRKKKQERIQNLQRQGYDGYWEYQVLSLVDDNQGAITPQKIRDKLNELALDGWRLKCSYANELGSNSSSSGIGGFSTGTNSTIDQNIFILERFIKFKD